MPIKIPKLSESQIARLADIFADLGMVFAASAVLPPVLDKFDPGLFFKGSSSALVAWLISLRFSR